MMGEVKIFSVSLSLSLFLSPSHTPVNGEVKTHEFSEIGLIVSQHACEVVAPVFVHVYNTHRGPSAVKVPVNNGSNGGQPGDKVHGVFVNVLEIEDKILTKNRQTVNKILTTNTQKVDKILTTR